MPGDVAVQEAPKELLTSGVGNERRGYTDGAIRAPTLYQTGPTTGKWTASVHGNGNPGTDASARPHPLLSSPLTGMASRFSGDETT